MRLEKGQFYEVTVRMRKDKDFIHLPGIFFVVKFKGITTRSTHDYSGTYHVHWFRVMFARSGPAGDSWNVVNPHKEWEFKRIDETDLPLYVSSMAITDAGQKWFKRG